MKRIVFFFLLLFPLLVPAQETAEAFLDKAVKAMKDDSAVQMDYTYTVYDENGKVVQADKGILRLNGSSYSLLMNDMKVWCNGKVQWSYMSEINEIYITDASSPEAQNLSPLYIMEMYRAGYSAAMNSANGRTEVTLETSSPDNNINKVKLQFDASTLRLWSMFIYMAGQGYIEVALDAYTAHCTFPADVYECPLKDYPAAEVVDMR